MIRPLDDPQTRALVERLFSAEGAFSSGIHPADEMLAYNLGLVHGDQRAAALLYYAKGRQVAAAARALVEAARGSGRRRVRMLDFASGFGRATRFLRGPDDPERLCVADVVAEAVDFQRGYLGVEGLYSHREPEAFRPGRRFDLIFVSSLFSHLPESSFGRWLERLWGLLEPEGVLALSTLDPSLLESEMPPDARVAEDFVFQPASESRVLDPESYGTAYAGEGFVRRVVEARLGSGVGTVRIPQGLCGHQDLYLLCRHPERHQPDLEARGKAVPRFPRGAIDTIRRLEGGATGEVELAGWACSTAEGGGAVEVRAWIANREEPELPAARRIPGGDRWSLRLDAEETGLDTLMAVTSHDRAGSWSLIGVGTLRPFLAEVEGA